MKYSNEQLKEKILEIMSKPEAEEGWPEEVLTLLRSQVCLDWSEEIVEGVSKGDLDEKMCTEVHDRFTKAELLLFGKEEAASLLEEFVPDITWACYDGEGKMKEQESFGMPLALAADKVASKIKNTVYTYETEQLSLFPEQTEQYDTSVMKWLINNLVAYANYQWPCKIQVKEFVDRLELVAEGTFLQKILRDTQQGSESEDKNIALRRIMAKCGLLDAEHIDITRVYELQCKKGLPLPVFDYGTPNHIQITIYGKVLDPNYTKLLTARDDLDLHTIFLLDKVQKQEGISKEEYQALRKKGLVEGRYPNIFVSYKIAGATGLKTNYVKNKGLGDDVYKKVLINALKTMGSANVRELFGVLKGALPDVMDKKQQARKISNLLQALKKQGIVKSKGTGQSAKWYLVK